MLPIETQETLINTFPDYFDLRADGEVRRYSIEKWWANEDREMDYPCAVFSLSPTGVTRDRDTPLTDHLWSEDNTSSGGSYDEVKGHRVYDVLNITCAARGVSGGVSARSRAAILARRMEMFLRFGWNDTHLNEKRDGQNQLPMVIPTTTIDGPVDRSGMVDDTSVSRYQLSANINYTLAVRQSPGYAEEFELEFPEWG